MARILELRAMQDRDFIGPVELGLNLLWLVAEEDGVITAAAAGCFTGANGKAENAIVSEFYDDGSLAGKRGLLAILDDAARANVNVYAIIPKDREGLVKALARRGFRITGTQMEKKRART